MRFFIGPLSVKRAHRYESRQPEERDFGYLDLSDPARPGTPNRTQKQEHIHFSQIRHTNQKLNDMNNKISRGDFLKRSGLAAAGIMMGGMASLPSRYPAVLQRPWFAYLVFVIRNMGADLFQNLQKIPRLYALHQSSKYIFRNNQQKIWKNNIPIFNLSSPMLQIFLMKFLISI